MIDENRYLHRLIGRFTWANGMWWLVNTGSSIALRLADARGPSYAKVAPGATVPLAYETAVLTFEAGGRPYELHLELLVDTPWFGVDPVDGGRRSPATPSTSRRPRRRARSRSTTSNGCCSSRCASRGSTIRRRTSCPTNRQIAARLGWTITKYNRKLDWLCQKYASAGVSGLRGSSDLLARDRRVRLVEHALDTGVVTAADLSRLPGARPA